MRSSVRQGSPDGLFPCNWDAATAASSPGERGVCPRPAISPLLAAAACAWVGVEITSMVMMDLWPGAPWAQTYLLPPVLGGGATVMVILVVMVLRLSRWRSWLIWASLGALGGGIAGLVFMGGVLSAGASLVSASVAECSFIVETDPRASAFGGLSFQAYARSPEGREGRVQVDVRGDYGTTPAMGCVLVCKGSWRELDLSNDFDRSLAQRGICARVKVASFEERGFQPGLVGAIRGFRRRMLDALEPDTAAERALTAGVVCGNQAALAGFDVKDDFADLGLSHLVAVSGSHLAVVGSLLGYGLRGARVRPAARLAATAAVLGAYVVFTGVQPSAVRSWIMAMASSGALVAGRRSHAVSAVCAAALAMVVASPASAASMGFQLSVLSVLGLALFAGFAQAWIACAVPVSLPAFVTEALSLTVVSQLFTAPVCLPAFGTVPLLAPLANLVAGPLVGVLLMAGVVCGPLAALVPAAAPWLLAPCTIVAGATCSFAGLLAAVPGAVYAVDATAAVGVPLALAAAFLYATWPAPSQRVAYTVAGAVILVCLAIHLRWGVFAPARLVVLDVGQGDAVLIQDGSHALLVDTGPGEAVVSALARHHVRRLDAVLITHTDLDHAGGLGYLKGRVRVESVVVARGVGQAAGSGDSDFSRSVLDAVGNDVLEVGAGDAFDVGGFSVAVVWPRTSVSGAQNDESIVAVASYHGAGRTLSALLTGDAESDVVGPLLEDGSLERVDVLKVGHHGSVASTTAAMVRGLDPLVAVASAGKGNRYGHPSAACVAAVEEEGAAFHCTADCGDVELRPAGEGVEVRCSVRER